MLKVSKYNIITKVKDSPDYFIMNALSGSADILTAAEYSLIKQGNIPDNPDFIEKGYVVDEAAEEKRFREEYFKFLDQRDDEEIQLFFIPSYACNFNCFYCYQDEYTTEKSSLTHEIIDAFFHYIDKEFGIRKKYITLFGGEPLLPSAHQKAMIDYFIEQTNKRGLGISVVTNGYLLSDYLPILRKAKIREIQVTLDGTASCHNKRRPLKNGDPTFDRIVRGIDASLEAGLPINLRVVLDRENLANLPELAHFAMEKGWTKSGLFKTQLGRNYELHSCQRNPEILLSRLELHRELYDLIKKNPEILDFHKPSFSIAKHLFENGTLPQPIFDDCPGAKYEWAFDFRGNIYACTATVGKSGEELGTFFPEVKKYDDKIACWEDRDITTIPGCGDCPSQLLCGGGCASLAKNKNGSHLSKDCRPFTELLELGIGLYYDDSSEEEIK
ncbi:MAG: radical SAM protein [Spirochaetales bacterium]|nr:radical SAM protein [Spirochaetales bacterium]